MDSQLAAFEKFKASGSGKNFTRESRNSDGPSSAMDGPAPDLYSIHHGKVVRVEDFGAFVQIPGFRRHGLVHKTQASRHFTQHVSDVVAVGDQVWVKVISLQDDKIALSMKYVSQGDGTDLDTNLVQLTEAADKRRVHTGFMDKAPISIEEGGVLLKTVCKKCGAAGHLAAECFSGGEKFELLADDDEDDNDNRYAARVRSSDKEKKKKDKDRDRESRRDRKEKKESSSHKKEKKRGRSRSASPKRRMDDHRGSKVESVEDALAVMRAHKNRRRGKSGEGEENDDERKDRKRSERRRRSRSESRSRSASPRRSDDRRDREDRDRRDRDRDQGHDRARDSRSHSHNHSSRR